jgi:hypothetical protein
MICWGVTVKKKTVFLITVALKSLFLNMKPITPQSDKVTNFVNTNTQRYLQQQGKYHTTHNLDIKSHTIEHFIQKFKTKINKYLTKNKS